jgi:hypothetical protein
LYTETIPWIFPFHGAVDTSDLAGAAFQTAGKFDHHLSLLGKRIEVCRTGINTETFFAVLTDFLIQSDMRLFIILKGIEGQFLGYLHQKPFFVSQGFSLDYQS